jgi:EAL domain-containing protein (putative c-di-GMP-specific phosphodiesterase class I)
MIVPAGEWVLRTACRQGKAWQESVHGPLRVAANLSARQFGREGLVNTVAGILEETGLDPRFLELEMNESLRMEDVEASTRALDELKRSVSGIRIAIDDLGTGYSSLYRLKALPIDLLKIDRFFVRDIMTDPDDAILTNAIIGLAHDLRLKVIAEGVETGEQMAFLREHGCDLAQGHYLSRPILAGELTELLENETRNRHLAAGS